MSKFDLPQDVSDRINQGMDLTGSGVELPFPAPVFRVLNGQANMRALNNAQFFGGWATDAPEFLDALEMWGEKEPPAEYQRETLTTQEGKDLDSFITRSVICAPIGMRSARWLIDPATNRPRQRVDQNYVKQPGEKVVFKVQAVVYLACKGNGGFHPLGPVMLTASNSQGIKLLNAFKEWNKYTSSLRNRVANKVPAWFFYLAIGTFGANRVQEMIGSGEAKSPITPIGPYLKPNLSEQDIEALFVGPEIASMMADLSEDAKPWLDAWKGSPQPAAAMGGDGPVFDDHIPNEPPAEDDIPF